MAFAPAAPARAATYTLEQLIRRVAATGNSDAAREAIFLARAQLRQAHLLWLPGGDVFLTMTGGPDVKCLANVADVPNTKSICLATNVTDLRTSSNLPTADGRPTSIDGPGLYGRAPIHNFLLNFTVSIIQPIWSSGKIESADALGEAAVAAARGTQTRDLADLAITIARAYWNRKSSRAEVAVLEDAVRELERWRQQIERQLDGNNEAGYTEADVARLKLQIVNVRQWLTDQQRWALATRDAVRVLTGDPDADVDDEELALLPDARVETLQEWQSRVDHRPDMQLLHAGLNASHALLRLKIAELLPDIGLYSGLGYGLNTIPFSERPATGYIPQPPGALGGGIALVTHQHLDFGAGLGRWSQVHHEDRANRARAEEALGGIAIEVAKTWSDFREAVGRADVTGHGVTITRGWVISVDEDLSAGIYRDVRELTDSFRQWAEWRIRHAQAVSEANIAYAVLRRASDLDANDFEHMAAELTGRQP